MTLRKARSPRVRPAQGAARTRSERGASPVSILIMLFILFLIIELIGLGGKVASAQLHVENAAREGARRASISQTGDAARNIGEQVARDNLDSRCQNEDADLSYVSGGSFAAGATLRVEAICQVDLSAFSLLSLPWPAIDLSASQNEIIEFYRAID